MIPGVLAFNDSDQAAGSDDKASGVISPKSRRESPGPVTHNQFGQTVGTPCALFADCGLTWLHIRPVVNLQAWPFTYRPEARAFTSISTWEIEDWIVGENEAYYENSKRINYLRFANLPKNRSLSWPSI